MLKSRKRGKYPTYFFIASCALKRITHCDMGFVLSKVLSSLHPIKIQCVDCEKKTKAHPLLNLTEMVMDLGKETTLTLGFCKFHLLL